LPKTRSELPLRLETSKDQDNRFAVAVAWLARLQVQRPQIALLAVVAINDSVPAIVRQSTRGRAAMFSVTGAIGPTVVTSLAWLDNAIATPR
jgi:hypothetical protein